MMPIVIALGLLVAVATIPGTLELALLTFGGALRARSSRKRSGSTTLRLAVVIPAHNEEKQIARCVKSVLAAETNNIHLTVAVVADNCTDGTAQIARESGAEVLERTNHQERGKGYALHHAFSLLQPRGFDVFMVVDADSVISANALGEICNVIADGADAAQCRYLVRNPGDSARTRLMNTALLAFNVLRPRGRDRFGMSVGIFGNGFALTNETLTKVPYEASSVVEDLEYHLALIRAGRRVRFVDGTTVFGDMPAAGQGVSSQRQRWEGGRFRMLAERGPGLLGSILHGKFRFVEPLLDLLLLPLAFHVVLLAMAAMTPSIVAREIAWSGIAVVSIHLIVTATVCGNGWRDLAALAAAPFYIVWKLLMLPSILRSSRTDTAWVRTERVPEERVP